MILCFNPNAAIDRTIVVERLALGEIHRPKSVKALPGGKGCNVARALHRFGREVTVSGWVGGSAGQFIEQGLDSEGIAGDFVFTDSESRTCTSILDEQGGQLTEFYEAGEPVKAEDVEAMLAHFAATISFYDAVTLSGSLPPGVPTDFYAQLIEIARAASVPTFLDSSESALREGIRACPFLVKPNEAEVTALTGRSPATMTDYAEATSSIAAQYNTVVALSLGARGAVVAQGSQVTHVQNPPVDVQSPVGSGDSMLAGLVTGFLDGLNSVEAAMRGVAAGTANCLTPGGAEFSLADYEDIHARLQLHSLRGSPPATPQADGSRK